MTKTTETKATPIAELTPEQFNARFPVGTRVMVLERGKMREAVTSRPAKEGHGCNVVAVQRSPFTWALSFVRPIVTLGSLNVGDEFRWHAETPSAGVYRVTRKSESGNVYARSAASGVQDTLCHPDTLVQVVALNLGAAQDDRPEVFPGAMLCDGDVVEMAGWDSYDPRNTYQLNALRGWNEKFAPARVVGAKLMSPNGEEGTPDNVSVYVFRLVPATIPAPAPTEPGLAPEPSETEQETPERKCSGCGALENKYRSVHKISNLCAECSVFMTLPNGTFLPPKPPRKLAPAVAYHLDDDCDASGIPEWN